MRATSGDDSFVTEQEIFRKPMNEIVTEALIRPFRELWTFPYVTVDY